MSVTNELTQAEKLFKSIEKIDTFSKLSSSKLYFYYKYVGELITEAKKSDEILKTLSEKNKILEEENEKLKVTMTGLFESAEKSS
mgnify:CR=1 FL=1